MLALELPWGIGAQANAAFAFERGLAIDLVMAARLLGRHQPGHSMRELYAESEEKADLQGAWRLRSMALRCAISSLALTVRRPRLDLSPHRASIEPGAVKGGSRNYRS